MEEKLEKDTYKAPHDLDKDGKCPKHGNVRPEDTAVVCGRPVCVRCFDHKLTFEYLTKTGSWAE